MTVDPTAQPTEQEAGASPAPVVAVLGAGVVGRTLAQGWAARGRTVLLGSRDPYAARMAEVVREVGAAGGQVEALTHTEAAERAGVVVVTVPGEQVPDLVAGLGGALAGRIVVDATNNPAPGAPAMNAVETLRSAGAVVYRGYNTTGWEQMARPVFGERPSDLPFAGPPEHRDVVAALIRDTGFRPLYLGEGPAALAANDALARLWFLLAFEQHLGRRLGFSILTAADD